MGVPGYAERHHDCTCLSLISFGLVGVERERRSMFLVPVLAGQTSFPVTNCLPRKKRWISQNPQPSPIAEASPTLMFLAEPRATPNPTPIHRARTEHTHLVHSSDKDNHTGPMAGVRDGERSEMIVLCCSGGLGGLFLLKPSPNEVMGPDIQHQSRRLTYVHWNNWTR